MKYTFEIVKRADVKGKEYPINLRIGTIRRSLGITSEVRCWNKTDQNVNQKHPQYEAYSNYIRALKARIDSVYREKPDISPKELFDELKRKNTSQLTLLDLIQEIIESLNQNNKFGNARIFKTLKNHVSNCWSKAILIKEFRKYHVQEFKAYLENRGVKTGGQATYLSTLRRVYNYAVDREYIVALPHNPFKGQIKPGKPKPKATTIEGVNSIRQLKLVDKSRKDLARDLLICSFNLQGMNFIDLFQVQIEDIQQQNYSYVRTKLRGSGEKVDVAITQEARRIFKKWSGKRKSGFVFPMLKDAPNANQKAFTQYKTWKRNIDKELSWIGKQVGIYSLSSYVARHSWATIADQLKIPIQDIQAGLGHSSRTTTEIYIQNLRKGDQLDINERISKGE